MAENYYIAAVTFSGATPERVAELFAESGCGLAVELNPPLRENEAVKARGEAFLAKYGNNVEGAIIDGHTQHAHRSLHASFKPKADGTEVAIWTGSAKLQRRYKTLLQAIAAGDRLAATEIVGALRLSPPERRRGGG